VTTATAGAFQQGANPFIDPASIIIGLPFACTLMSILLFHEMGHYLVARTHGVRASLPYFIPGPPFFIGTFGAFIRMRVPPANRQVLFDVGAAGPWAGVVLAVPAVIVGLQLSEVQPLSLAEGGLILGDSVLFSLLTRLTLGVSAGEANIVLHPVALAGWFGLFVTFLNLLPVGQLDGGHIAYSLFGRYHRWISRAFLLVILVLGFQGWQGWFIWAVLLSMLGVDHPPTLDLFSSLDLRRKLCGWLTVGLFLLTFIPVPLAVVERPSMGEAVTVSYSASPTGEQAMVLLGKPTAVEASAGRLQPPSL
jgi:membrane-associated protease RseP (regulator of RpoE activity)